ncbi:hypothetical protein L3X38_007952 [Prunus dulcis]|uniref:Uncharacterized protein n=1 Tax=Prunus dulcis TaxID=3755 RepID=A0AAD4ZVI8_PRUDU|nr:hypothetical protein L3X38_007952 [Prunus dulcis]
MGDHPGKLLRELPRTKPCRLIQPSHHRIFVRKTKKACSKELWRSSPTMSVEHVAGVRDQVSGLGDVGKTNVKNEDYSRESHTYVAGIDLPSRWNLGNGGNT